MTTFKFLNTINKLCNKYDFTSFHDMLILSYISENKGSSIREMFTTCELKRVQTNRICTRLKEKGFIDSVPASLDMQSAQNVFDVIKQLYTITKKGQNVMKEVIASLDDVNKNE